MPTRARFYPIVRSLLCGLAVLPTLAPLAHGAAAPAYQSASLSPILVPPAPDPPAPLVAPPASNLAPGPYDTWTQVSNKLSPRYWSVKWLNNQFIATGDNATIVTSPDGLVWTPHHNPMTMALYDIAYDGKTYVAVGHYGSILSSPDLTRWSTRANNLSDPRYFTVVWTGKQFVAAGDGIVSLSPDGMTWNTPPTAKLPYFHHATWANGQIIAATGNGTVSSPDGTTWTRAPNFTGRMMGVASDGKVAVAVGPADMAYSSTDGLNWEKHGFSSIVPLAGVVWTGKEFAAAGMGVVATSPDGVTWTPHTFASKLQVYDIAAHNGTVVLVTATGEILLNRKIAKAPMPDITLAPGAPGSVPQVMITDTAAGAKIYYTDDGTDPTPAAKLYTTPFSPATACIIRACAYADGYYPGDEAAAKFTPGP